MVFLQMFFNLLFWLWNGSFAAYIAGYLFLLLLPAPEVFMIADPALYPWGWILEISMQLLILGASVLGE
ncbi:hypothetical protein GGR56DRAFT_675942 [Xylariaceae sp. FL0804]|nr:hypothetical protein GGR56DRAFT_675942 [Xylariaceae sp. FL0804]